MRLVNPPTIIWLTARLEPTEITGCRQQRSQFIFYDSQGPVLRAITNRPHNMPRNRLTFEEAVKALRAAGHIVNIHGPRRVPGWSYGPSADSVDTYTSKRRQCQLPVYRG